jgi:hypothetical protein
MAYMGSLDQFSLEAEISLTEFRSEHTVTSRLQKHHRLRVRRRSDLIGVFLDAAEWQQIVQHVARLENEVERRDDDAARAIIATRTPGAVFEAGSARRADEIEREYERIVEERTRSRAS